MIPVNQGCVVAIKCWWGEHWGIVAFENGQWTIISNRGIRGAVTEERWEDVVDSADWHVVALPTHLPAHMIIERARSKIGTHYDFWTWNCQDLAYWALGLQPQSPQRQAVVAALSIACIGIMFSVASKSG